MRAYRIVYSVWSLEGYQVFSQLAHVRGRQDKIGDAIVSHVSVGRVMIAAHVQHMSTQLDCHMFNTLQGARARSMGFDNSGRFTNRKRISSSTCPASFSFFLGLYQHVSSTSYDYM